MSTTPTADHAAAASPSATAASRDRGGQPVSGHHRRQPGERDAALPGATDGAGDGTADQERADRHASTRHAPRNPPQAPGPHVLAFRSVPALAGLAAVVLAAAAALAGLAGAAGPAGLSIGSAPAVVDVVAVAVLGARLIRQAKESATRRVATAAVAVAAIAALITVPVAAFMVDGVAGDAWSGSPGTPLPPAWAAALGVAAMFAAGGMLIRARGTPSRTAVIAQRWCSAAAGFVGVGVTYAAVSAAAAGLGPRDGTGAVPAGVVVVLLLGPGVTALAVGVHPPARSSAASWSPAGPAAPRVVANRVFLAAIGATLALGAAAAWHLRDATAVMVPAILSASVLVVTGLGLVTFTLVAHAEQARFEALDEAAASHNQLQKLIDNTSAIIYMKRVDDGQYLLVNREWERLFGVDRDRVVHLTDDGVFPPELAEQLRANDLAVARAGKTVQYEESADGADGVRIYMSAKFPVLDANGDPYAVCGISTDITDRKRAEEEVRRLNADLETRVRHRTAELEASTQELDAFAYSVSHDLRAPLRSLHGFSDALLEDYDDVLDDVGKDYLRRLQHNVKRMGRMIDDLLNLSRATRVELTRDTVDITAMTLDVLGELRAADPGRVVQCQIGDGLTASGDQHLLRLALQNLLANAWKFTAKRDDAQIQVGYCDGDGDGYFFIRDNGAGFDMRLAGKLFTAFQRLHPSSDFEGTGIGLAIVDRVVRRHGGRIWADATPGAGATFSFSLADRGAGPHDAASDTRPADDEAGKQPDACDEHRADPANQPHDPHPHREPQ